MGKPHNVWLKDGTNYPCQCKTRDHDHSWRKDTLEIENTCDVKYCGKPGVGHIIVGQEALLWMCLEHEL